ncbi:MAG: PspA/IM30 family protein [Chloroflexota bacterium]|nr:MAG: PspA/IM30 family protein [Chloroflexota bacterium]
MGIFDRVSMLVRSNLNDLLDRAEDPEKTLDQVTRDMADAINKAKAQVAETIAQKNLVESDFQEAGRLATEWKSKAEVAVRRGADDLAREALRRHKDYAANAQVYEHQLTSQVEVVDKLKSDLQALQSKYEQVVRNRQMLISRHRTAQAQQKVQQTAAALAGIDPTSELARMEDKIRLEEARAKAGAELGETSLDSRFAALEAEGGTDVEDELAALKAKVSPPALEPGKSA